MCLLLEAVISLVSAADVSVSSIIGGTVPYIGAASPSGTSRASASATSGIRRFGVSRSSTSAGSCSGLVVSAVARSIASGGRAAAAYSLVSSSTACIYIGTIKARTSARNRTTSAASAIIFKRARV